MPNLNDLSASDIQTLLAANVGTLTPRTLRALSQAVKKTAAQGKASADDTGGVTLTTIFSGSLKP